MPTKKENGTFFQEATESKGWDDFSKESLKKASDIKPLFEPWLNKEYKIKLVTLPKMVKTAIGESYVCEIEVEGTERSIWATGSFRFHLTKERDRLKIPSEELIGREFILQKVKGSYQGKETHFLSLIAVE